MKPMPRKGTETFSIGWNAIASVMKPMPRKGTETVATAAMAAQQTFR